jgi:hypothetical protein
MTSKLNIEEKCLISSIDENNNLQRIIKNIVNTSVTLLLNYIILYCIEKENIIVNKKTIIKFTDLINKYIPDHQINNNTKILLNGIIGMIYAKGKKLIEQKINNYEDLKKNLDETNNKIILFYKNKNKITKYQENIKILLNKITDCITNLDKLLNIQDKHNYNTNILNYLQNFALRIDNLGKILSNEILEKNIFIMILIIHELLLFLQDLLNSYFKKYINLYCAKINKLNKTNKMTKYPIICQLNKGEIYIDSILENINYTYNRLFTSIKKEEINYKKILLVSQELENLDIINLVKINFSNTIKLQDEPEPKKTEEPKLEEPIQEEPKPEDPKLEEPKPEEPIQEKPKPEDPKLEEPKQIIDDIINKLFEIFGIDKSKIEPNIIKYIEIEIKNVIIQKNIDPKTSNLIIKALDEYNKLGIKEVDTNIINLINQISDLIKKYGDSSKIIIDNMNNLLLKLLFLQSIILLNKIMQKPNLDPNLVKLFGDLVTNLNKKLEIYNNDILMKKGGGNLLLNNDFQFKYYHLMKIKKMLEKL